MTKMSHRGRYLCKDMDCSVEIENGQKYCNGHRYLISRWIRKSQAILFKALKRQAQEIA
jgi:hypothetical protein